VSGRRHEEWARAPSNRPQRVAEAIHRELAPPLQRLAADHGLGLLTITDVDVSPDLRNARVFVSQMGREIPHQIVIDLLANEAGRLRSLLAHALKLRTVPVVRFVFDESVERGARLSALIDALHEKDRQVPDESAGDDQGT
jgi:ribosome-binding factor A